MEDYENQMIWAGEGNMDSIFDLGEKAEEDIKNIQFILDWGLERSQDGYLTDQMILLGFPCLNISEKALEVFESLGVNNLQIFDIEIVDNKNDKVYKNYKIANIIGLCDCIDEAKSDVEYYSTGDVMMFNKLVIDESKIPKELLIFRLKQETSTIIIHESVKEAIEKNGLTGFVISDTYI